VALYVEKRNTALRFSELCCSANIATPPSLLLE
jgi:hypothetical protein